MSIELPSRVKKGVVRVSPTTFDEALAALLALVGERVEVHVMDAGQTGARGLPAGGLRNTRHGLATLPLGARYWTKDVGDIGRGSGGDFD
jgi:hypothetical protein